MIVIPENTTDFLYWVKERTENFWNQLPGTTEENYDNENWLREAKWIGLTDAEIDAVEQKYAIQFTPDHREFLRILHTLDRKELVTTTSTIYNEAGQSIGTESETLERPFFYNWLEDETEIIERMRWPYETILQDIQGPNEVWLDVWGEKPASEAEKEAVFARWYEQAPRLLPLYSHRFMVSQPVQAGNPVLSVYGSDIIVYGWNLRSYLLHELSGQLKLLHPVFDHEDGAWYQERRAEVEQILAYDYQKASGMSTPFWEDIILYWSSGWASFGQRYPYPADDVIQPIVKASATKSDSGPETKKFNNFS